MTISGRWFNCGGVIVTTVRRAFVAVLLGMWMVVSAAQEAGEEAGEEDTAESAAQLESDPGDGSTVADDALNESAAEQAETTAEGGVTDAVAADPDQAVPEIPPLDELFVPSQNIRADEPVTFPVDF